MSLAPLAVIPMSNDPEIPVDRDWITRAIDPEVIRSLAQTLPATELWSLLLVVMEQRAAARTPTTVTRQWQTDRFVAPAYVDQRTLLEVDRQLFAAAAQFEVIELSPLAPLGACSAIAPTSQNRIVTTARGTEVVSDPTNVLALESAHRLGKEPTVTVKLATSHRCVRAQSFPKLPGFAAHFRMFCLTTAGHETKDQAFTVEALTEQIRTHLRALDLLQEHGYEFTGRVVTLLSSAERRPLAQRIGAGLEVEVTHAELAKSYYNGLRFMINVTGMHGDIPLIDGGAFDWVAKLASNRKLAFVASAIGSQLVAHSFRRC